MNTEPLRAPYPSDTRAKGWRFELDYERIDQSDTWALAKGAARGWLLLQWLLAWRQVPCGSLPADEEVIAAKLDMPPKEWAKHRKVLMRGWERADDGRLYHPTVTARVLEMLEYRRKNAERVAKFKAALREQREGNALPERESPAKNDTGTGTGTGTSSKPYEAYASVTGKPETCEQHADSNPSCPSADIVALYHELMPLNPRVKVLNDTRKKAIRARWKEAALLTSKPFGYSNRQEGLAAWREFFEVCAESDFLTGKAPAQPGRPSFVADIDFLMSPTGFARCLENKYHREAQA